MALRNSGLKPEWPCSLMDQWKQRECKVFQIWATWLPKRCFGRGGGKKKPSIRQWSIGSSRLVKTLRPPTVCTRVLFCMLMVIHACFNTDLHVCCCWSSRLMAESESLTLRHFELYMYANSGWPPLYANCMPIVVTRANLKEENRDFSPARIF